MGAPNTAYLFNGTAKFPIHIEGEIKLDAYPALKLAEYGNNILSLFYLDALLIIDDEQGNVAFLGMVRANSLNLNMHNQSRWFKQRLAPEDTNTPYVVMNDAGLNTYGLTTYLILVNKIFDSLKISAGFRAAYYGVTTYGLYVSVNGGAYVKYAIGSVNSNAVANYEAFPAISLIIGDLVLVKSFTENNEGEYLHNEVLSFRVRPDKYFFKWVLANFTGYRTVTVSLVDSNENPITAEFNVTTYNRLVYTESATYNYDFEVSVSPGQTTASVTIYDSELGFDPGEPNVVESVGLLSHAPTLYDGIPIEQFTQLSPSIKLDYTGYSLNSYVNACTINTNKSIYRSGYMDGSTPVYYNDNYYATNFLTDLCDNGYYSVGGRWYLITNGLLVDDDSC